MKYNTESVLLTNQGESMLALRVTTLVLFLLSVFTPVPYPDPCDHGSRTSADIPCWED